MSNKRCLINLLSITLTLSVATQAHALLTDNGDGTITQTMPDGFQLMWLQDGDLAVSDPAYHLVDSDGGGIGLSWQESVDWASGLRGRSRRQRS